MKKILLLSFTQMIFYFNLIGQEGFEYSIFKETCNEMVKLHENLAIKNQVKSIQILIDPESMNYTLDTIKPLSIEEQELLSKKSEKELIGILSTEESSFLPLSNSILILDTLNFFHTNYTYKAGDYSFEIVKTSQKSMPNFNSQKLIYIYAFKIEEDHLVIAFSSKNGKKQFLKCSYKYSDKDSLMCECR